MDLTGGIIKKRCQEYTEKLYKKDLNDPDNHEGMITHTEPDILECEVKWASGSITMNKTSGGGGIPVELFQILKDDAVKVLHSIWQQIWKTQQWTQDWKRSVFIPIPKKGNAKECSNYHTIALISHEQSNAQNSPSEASIVNEPEEENFKTCTQLEITSCSFRFCNSNSSMKSKVSYIGWGDGTETYNNPRS